MEWISVDERLPEYNIPVLTFDINYPEWIQPLMLCEGEDGWLWAGLDTHMCNLLDSDNYVCDDEYICTHWMPLPDSPKE